MVSNYILLIKTFPILRWKMDFVPEILIIIICLFCCRLDFYS